MLRTTFSATHWLLGTLILMATKILFSAGVERLFGGQCPHVEEINTVTCNHKIKGVPVRALFTDLPTPTSLISSECCLQAAEAEREQTLPLVDVALTTFGSAAEIFFTMMAPEYYIFTGGVVPDHVTHVRIGLALKFVLARAFYQHANIQAVICHEGVEKIEQNAFSCCPRLRRVIMPGVKEVEKCVFNWCTALNYIECSKLEIIGEGAFCACKSLSSIDLPSIRIVWGGAFDGCRNLTNAKFGKDLKSISNEAFCGCTSLERITLPLKDRMFAFDDTFQWCKKLNHVDLVEGAILSETIAALLLEEWKDDMNEEIDSISRVLPNTRTGSWNDPGGKAKEIRTWIRSVLHKIVRYKAEHRSYLNEAATTLHSALPNDIVLKNVLPFLELPSYTFQGED